MLRRMPGCSACNRWNTRVINGCAADGTMPRRTSPSSFPDSARSSSITCSVCCSHTRSRVAARAPNSVSTTPRPVRLNKRPPHSASNSLICRLMREFTTWRRAATLLKLPASATSRKSLIVAMFILAVRELPAKAHLKP